jgi:hypothetical protein
MFLVVLSCFSKNLVNFGTRKVPVLDFRIWTFHFRVFSLHPAPPVSRSSSPRAPGPARQPPPPSSPRIHAHPLAGRAAGVASVPAGWPARPRVGLIPRARSLTFPSLFQMPPFTFPRTLAPPLPLPSAPPAAATRRRRQAPTDCLHLHHLLLLLARFRPTAAASSARSTLPGARLLPPPPLSAAPPPCPARPHRGRAPPLRRATRARAGPARSRPLPLLHLLAAAATHRRRARAARVAGQGHDWP